MKKKILTLCLVVVLAATAVIGGTLAYFTDTDSQTNVMTYGNVDIEQLEYERKEGIAHNATLTDGDLQVFTQDKKVYPAVLKGNDYELSNSKDEAIKWGPYTASGTAWNNIYDPDQVANAIDKFVFVKNNGSEDVYFRTIVAVETPEDWTAGHCGQGDEIGVIFNALYKDDYLGTSGGYSYYVFTYKDGHTLKAGEQAHPSLLQLVLNHNLDNADMAKLKDTFEVKVFTQACQAQGFDNMEQALSLAFDNGGKLTAEAAAALFN